MKIIYLLYCRLSCSVVLTLLRSYLLLIILFCMIIGCHSPGAEEHAYAEGTEEGYRLAKQYCGSCHTFVPAEMLDKKTWDKGVLPAMSKELGIKRMWDKYLPAPDASINAIPMDRWDKIIDYYLKTAPDTLLPATAPTPIIKDSTAFTVKVPEYRNKAISRTIMARADTVNDRIYTSDFTSRYLTEWTTTDLVPVDSVRLQYPVVDATFAPDQSSANHTFTTIGFLKPTNFEAGSLWRFEKGVGLDRPYKELIKGLARPVHTVKADMNNDGLDDYVVCEFGYTQKGALSIIKAQPDGTYQRIVLREWPGATMTVVKDFNNDGWNDIMALFGQDQESIRLYINNRNNTFTEQVIMKFNPVYGSSSFQLVDFNNDGLEDILYTAGDNADHSIVFKPYHGLYIYLNKGNYKYEQVYFYPINGSTKAIAADFDRDGDLDIATIAYYADFTNKSEEGFLYFEQTGPFDFKVHSLPIQQYGRWLTMEAVDINKDGYLDLLLGNSARELFVNYTGYKPWDPFVPFVVLENNFKNKK